MAIRWRRVRALSAATVFMLGVGLGGSVAGAAGPPDGLNVNVTNTPDVNVVNELSVRSPDAPGVQPYHCRVEITTEALISEQDCPEPVPDGKRLVVEHVSATAGAPAGRRAFVVVRRCCAGPSVRAPLAFQFNNGVVDVLVASQQVRLYIDGGETVNVLVIASQGVPPTLHVDVTVVGYLIDQP